MTRNTQNTDELEEIPLFREEEGDIVEEVGAEALQEEVEELLGEDEIGEEPEVLDDEPVYDLAAEPAEVEWRPASRSGVAGFVLGSLLAAGGIALGAASGLGFESLVATLGGLGIAPATLVTVGLVVVFLSGMRGHVHGSAARVAALEQALAHQGSYLQQSVDYLVEQQRLHGDRPPASGEELDRVLLVMQRLDEKINNLTKAFKMYGKPLVEISNQSTDIAAEVNDLRTLVDGVQETVTQGFQRGEQSLRAVAEGGALQEKLAAGVEAVQQGLQQGLQSLRDELAQVAGALAETRQIGEGFERLEKRLDETAGKLLEGLQQAGPSGEGSSDLEGPIREIQREVAGMATTLANLQHKVAAGGGGRPAPAAQGQPAAAAKPSPAAGSSGGTGGATGGVLAQSISGTKKATGKNVLGAIAKLRQMRN